MKEFKVAITYGEEREKTKVYSFDTQAERDAFFLGLDQCVGWHDYKIVGEDDDTFEVKSIALVIRCNESWECQEYEEIEEGWTDRNLDQWTSKDRYRGESFTFNIWDYEMQKDQWNCRACQSTNVTVTEVSS